MELSLSYICDRSHNIYQTRLQQLEQAGYKVGVHMDPMDGHFVPFRCTSESLDEINYNKIDSQR